MQHVGHLFIFQADVLKLLHSQVRGYMDKRMFMNTGDTLAVDHCHKQAKSIMGTKYFFATAVDITNIYYYYSDKGHQVFNGIYSITDESNKVIAQRYLLPMVTAVAV